MTRLRTDLLRTSLHFDNCMFALIHCFLLFNQVLTCPLILGCLEFLWKPFMWDSLKSFLDAQVYNVYLIVFIYSHADILKIFQKVAEPWAPFAEALLILWIASLNCILNPFYSISFFSSAVLKDDLN